MKQVASDLILNASRSKHIRRRPLYLEDCADALVALLPHSYVQIRSLLASDSKDFGELQFAVLTFVTAQADSRRAPGAKNLLLRIVREYLAREGANADGQYMNGVFALATSFPVRISLSELEKLIRGAKRPECRALLVRGLHTVARRHGAKASCRRLLEEFEV